MREQIRAKDIYPESFSRRWKREFGGDRRWAKRHYHRLCRNAARQTLSHLHREEN